MSKKKKKFYVVWEGHIPGVYSDWNKCKQQIDGYQSARYKGFTSKEAADDAFFDSPWDHIGENVKKSKGLTGAEKEKYGEPILNSVCVDAACSGNPGPMEYRGVFTQTEKQLFHQGPFPYANNNVGEFLALVHALALLHKQGSNIPIYSDSRTAMSWVRHKRIKSNLKRKPINEPVFKMLDRAIIWLHAHPYTNPIIKWPTEVWGEIPADFGRK